MHLIEKKKKEIFVVKDTRMGDFNYMLLSKKKNQFD
jgi:hypothetical protein